MYKCYGKEKSFTHKALKEVSCESLSFSGIFVGIDFVIGRIGRSLSPWGAAGTGLLSGAIGLA